MITQESKCVHTMECKCFTWKPIIAGALAAIGFSFLLNLFSVAIGLTAFNTNSEGIENLALGGLAATSLGIIVSMFASGWLAGYLGNRYCSKRHLGALYGFLTWCVALIVMIFLTEYIQHYITAYTHFISGTTVTTINAANGSETPLARSALSTNSLVISTYIVFCLFFLSAFACCLGGHCGMRYVNKDERLT